MHKKKRTQEKGNRKSLMVDFRSHEYIKNLASKLGISQLKCFAMIIDEKKHRDKLDSKRKTEEFEDLDIQTAMNQINRRLERIEKRENPRDTIVSFYKTQERDILNPMKLDVNTALAKLDELLDAIKAVQ